MTDTPRTLAALLTASADNTTGAYSLQNLRDLIVSAIGPGQINPVGVTVSPVWSGTSVSNNSAFGVSGTSVTGSSTATSGVWLNYFYDHDQVQYTGTQSVSGLVVGQDFGGASSRGSRQGLMVTLNQIGATDTFSSGHGSPYFVGSQFYVICNTNEGGSSSSFSGGTGSGQAFGTSAWARLVSGATNYQSVTGAEYNVSVQSGASVQSKTGLAIVKTNDDVVQGGDGLDTALGIADQIGTTAYWDVGLSLGGNASQWPFRTTSTLITAAESQNAVNQAKVAYGVDFRRVLFTAGAFASMGFSVDGNGKVASQNLSIRNYILNANTTGLTIDAPSQIVSAFSVAAGGSGWTVGDYATTANGGVYQVATVSAGAVATLTQIVADTTASPPSNPVTAAATNTSATNNPYRSGGTGLTLTLTWVAANLISLGSANVSAVHVNTTLVAAANGHGFTHAFLDGSNCSMLNLWSPAAAVNGINISAGATGQNAFIGASGSDANIHLELGGQGTGLVVIDTGMTAPAAVFGTGAAEATTATTGHLLIPFCAGAPTGVPSNASQGVSIRYDTTNHKLWAYDNGTSTWKGIVLT